MNPVPKRELPLKTTLKQQCAVSKAARIAKRAASGRTPGEAERHIRLVLAIDQGADAATISHDFCVELSTARRYISLWRIDPLLR